MLVSRLENRPVRGRTNAMLDFILIVLTLFLFFVFDRYTAGLEHL